MQKLLITWARLCDKSKFYDSFSYQSSIVFPLILTCNISFENGLKSQIQWYNNQNNQIKTIEMTKLWTNLPSNHLKPQMYDSVFFSHTHALFGKGLFLQIRFSNFIFQILFFKFLFSKLFFVADGINSVGDYNSSPGGCCLSVSVCVCPHFFSRFTIG